MVIKLIVYRTKILLLISLIYVERLIPDFFGDISKTKIKLYRMLLL